MTSHHAAPNPAARAEPRSIGTARARDPLAREVRLLGSLLGQVIVEQAGLELFELVERVRGRTIALRRGDGPLDPAERRRLAEELDALAPEQADRLARAFGLYFQLVNLAEEKQRVRALRKRERTAAGKPLEESAGAAVRVLHRAGWDGERLAGLVGRLTVTPVWTAHPTEARRRTLLVALRRCYALLDRLDDPRLTPAEDAEVRRRLREEITILWQTADLRTARPTPLDEVRTALVFFDETLFTLTPRLYRVLDGALGTGSGSRPPRVPALLSWGSWIGGDRDGNPAVTAEVTRQVPRLHADHLLRGYERVAERLMQTVAVSARHAPVPETLLAALARDAAELPATARTVERRFPDEPYRRSFGFLAERLRRTRARLAGGEEATPGAFASPGELLAELRALQAGLLAGGAVRVAWGSVQDLIWQVETFGFHLASLEVRQHADVHRAALERLGGPLDAAGALAPALPEGLSVAEVVATFRAVADVQARYGEAACHRYVVSFAGDAADAHRVIELARIAGDAERLPPGWTGDLPAAVPALDVVPLFETLDDLERSPAVLAALLADAAYAPHLVGRGGRQEVMLGYSDSNKESGPIAAAWGLYRAQKRLAEAARQRGVELTLFHGRGGAIGRGGGPANHAILGQAPGSIGGHLKFTEQGEVIADHYGNATIAGRHLEQLLHATLVASSDAHAEALRVAEARWAATMDELAAEARRAYRALVWEDAAFEPFFHAATPYDEIADLNLGSRPAARDGARRLAAIRAIPWVFAWSQNRANLPGWYGLGSALETFVGRHGEAGRRELGAMYRHWSFAWSVLDTAELALAKADPRIARLYADLVPDAPAAGRIATAIEGEYQRSVALLLAVTGRARLLDGTPELQRSIDLRNPYVDSLSELQVRLLARLRALPPDDPARAELRRVVQLTINGVAAGVRNTG